MLRHIVMFSTTTEENYEKVYRGLKILENINPNWKVEVRKNLKKDLFNNTIDFVVYGEFPNIEALNEYHAHPIYSECIKLVKPFRDLRISADIISE